MKRFNQKYCCFTDNMKKRFRNRFCSKGISPLSQHCCSGRVKIHQVRGDRRQCARMADLGLFPGTEAELICADKDNQCILKVNGGTICLDSSISDNILVSGS